VRASYTGDDEGHGDFLLDALSKEQVAETGEAALLTERMSYRQIAEADGSVSHPTVMSALAGGKGLPAESSPKVTGTDGKSYPATKPRRSTIIAA